MSDAIARALDALDRFPVSYELTATDTVIEGESVEQVFAAVRAAHEAIPHDRVITSVEIDETRGRGRDMYERIESVERTLGRPARRVRRPPREIPPQSREGPPQSREASGQPQEPHDRPAEPRSADRSSERTRSPERPRERRQGPMPTPHDNRM